MSLGQEYRQLGAVPPFSVLDGSRLKLLSFICHRIHFEAGDWLCRQGEVADGIFVLVDGEVEVTLGGEGREHVIRRMKPFAFIGEIGALAQAERTATVTAITPVTALKLDQAQFYRLLQDHPELRQAVEDHIAAADYIYE